MSDVRPLTHYRHDTKALYAQYEQHLITHDEFRQRLEELTTKEVQVQEPLGRLLVTQRLDEVQQEAIAELR